MRHIVAGLSLAIIAAVGLGCDSADRAETAQAQSGRAGTTPLPAPQPTAKPSGFLIPKTSSPALHTISDDDLARELSIKLEADVDPTAGSLQLMWVKGKWAYWHKMRLKESTQGHRIQFFLHKYYLQRIGEPRARFVEKFVERYHGPDDEGKTMAVLDDGAVVNHTNDRLQWISPDGTTTLIEKPDDCYFVRIDADGVLRHTKPNYSAGGDRSAYAYGFVPFAGKSLDWKNLVEVSPSGVEYLRRAQPVRYKNEFAWTDGRTIRFVDIKTGKRRTLELKAPADYHASHFHIRMFDDKVIVGPLDCFDAATGEMFGERDPNKSERRGMGLFALHDGIGYYFDLTDPRGYQGSRKILTADPQAKTFERSELAWVSHRPVGQDEQGLVLWTGGEWQHVPWVKWK